MPGASSFSAGYSKVKMAQEAHRIINSSPSRRQPRTVRSILYHMGAVSCSEDPLLRDRLNAPCPLNFEKNHSPIACTQAVRANSKVFLVVLPDQFIYILDQPSQFAGEMCPLFQGQNPVNVQDGLFNFCTPFP